MADEKISAMPAAVSVGASDIIPIVQGGVNKTVTGQVLSSSIGLAGTGSPEGVVSANPGTPYTDNTGGIFTGFWLKITGTGNTGWFQLI